MRFASRASSSTPKSNLLTLRANRSLLRDDPGLTAFRGMLVAASLSALFWGACFTVVWLLRSKS
jgi:hypothetical protein